MVRSKRSREGAKSKTQAKGRKEKEGIVTQVRECCDTFPYIYLFSVENMRNTYLKDIRVEWKDSRFFFGRNKVMAIGLGTSPENEHKNNIHQLGQRLEGNVGLLFSKRIPADVIKYFEDFSKTDYARSGFIATTTIKLDAGVLYCGASPFATSSEPMLRKLGLPTALQNGQVVLTNDYVVCEEGDALTPDQARLLKLLLIKMADFQVKILAFYHDGKFKEIA